MSNFNNYWYYYVNRYWPNNSILDMRNYYKNNKHMFLNWYIEHRPYYPEFKSIIILNDLDMINFLQTFKNDLKNNIQNISNIINSFCNRYSIQYRYLIQKYISNLSFFGGITLETALANNDLNYCEEICDFELTLYGL